MFCKRFQTAVFIAVLWQEACTSSARQHPAVAQTSDPSPAPAPVGASEYGAGWCNATASLYDLMASQGQRSTPAIMNSYGAIYQQLQDLNVSATLFFFPLSRHPEIRDAMQPLYEEGGDDNVKAFLENFVLQSSLPGKLCLSDLLERRKVNSLLGLLTNTSKPLQFEEDEEGNVRVSSPTMPDVQLLSVTESCNGVIYATSLPLWVPNVLSGIPPPPQPINISQLIARSAQDESAASSSSSPSPGSGQQQQPFISTKQCSAELGYVTDQPDNVTLDSSILDSWATDHRRRTEAREAAANGLNGEEEGLKQQNDTNSSASSSSGGGDRNSEGSGPSSVVLAVSVAVGCAALLLLLALALVGFVLLRRRRRNQRSLHGAAGVADVCMTPGPADKGDPPSVVPFASPFAKAKEVALPLGSPFGEFRGPPPAGMPFSSPFGAAPGAGLFASPFDAAQQSDKALPLLPAANAFGASPSQEIHLRPPVGSAGSGGTIVSGSITPFSTAAGTTHRSGSSAALLPLTAVAIGPGSRLVQAGSSGQSGAAAAAAAAAATAAFTAALTGSTSAGAPSTSYRAKHEPPGDSGGAPGASGGSGGAPRGSGGSGGAAGASTLCTRNGSDAESLSLALSACEGSGTHHSLLIDPSELQLLADSFGRPMRLGSGSFGTVYRGVRHGSIPVAIKVPLLPLCKEDSSSGSSGGSDGSSGKRGHKRQGNDVFREASNLLGCRDPSVVQFLGMCFLDGSLVLVTEYMPGGDLYDALTSDDKEDYMWHRQGKYLALDIVRGLVYMHCKRMAHLDLKPNNVLLCGSRQQPRAKISDLGLSSVLTGSYLSAAQPGTFAWAAPELLMGQRVSVAADMYSFGVILWQLVTGEVPRRGRLDMEGLRQSCHGSGLVDLIAACLAGDPKQRPTAREAHDAIQAMVEASEGADALLTSAGSPSLQDGLRV